MDQEIGNTYSNVKKKQRLIGIWDTWKEYWIILKRVADLECSRNELVFFMVIFYLTYPLTPNANRI